MKRRPTPHRLPRHVMLFFDRELRGPITNILALSQTLAAGRVSRASVREYARMVSFEAVRLKRLAEEMAVLLGLEKADVSLPAATRGRTKRRVSRPRVISQDQLSDAHD